MKKEDNEINIESIDSGGSSSGSFSGNGEKNKKEKKVNPIIKLIVNHYKQNPQKKTEQQIEKEKYLIGNIKFNRWLLFPCALLTQFTVGSLYSWSIYNKPVDYAIYGDSFRGMAPNTFYIVFFFFGCACSILGPVLDRLGPRNSMFLGSSLFVLGHFVTAVGIHVKTIWLVYIGYGALGGMGMGITYISPISSLQKWFPDHRGLAAGLAVCGFGAGSIAFGVIPIKIIAHVGLSLNFVILGCIFLAILYPTSLIFRTPPPNFQINGKDSDNNEKPSTIPANSTDQQPSEFVENDLISKKSNDQLENSQNVKIVEPKFSDYKLADAIVSREYTIIYIMFLCNVMFGVVAIGRLSDMVQNMFGKSKDVGSVVVSVNGAFNLFGRLFFAILSDKIGRKKCFQAMLTIQCVSVGFLIYSMKTLNYDAFIGLIWISTFCYGGGFGVIPAFLNDMFGSKNVGAVHGLILSAWAVAGVVGGIVFTTIYNNLINHHGYSHTSAFPFLVNYYWIIAFLSFGWCICWLIRVNVMDAFLPPVKGQIVLIPLFNKYYLRISTSIGFEWLSKQQIQNEWNQYLINNNNQNNK